MIFNIPAGTTSESPYVPNFESIDTAQLPLEVLHVRGTGTCYVRLPAIANLSLYNAKVLISGESEDANIFVTPSGLDEICFRSALIDSAHSGNITGNGSTMELTTVLESGLGGTTAALWYSPNPSSQSVILPLYVFGTQNITFTNTSAGQDQWMVTFNEPLNDLNKSVQSLFAELDWNVSFWSNNVKGAAYTNGADRTILSTSFSGNGAGTYICSAGYFYSDAYSNLVYIEFCSFIKVDSAGNIISRIDISGISPSSINGSNDVNLTLVTTTDNTPAPTFQWFNYNLGTPLIGSGGSLVYTIPSGASASIVAQPTIDAGTWSDIDNVVNVLQIDNAKLIFRVIPA